MARHATADHYDALVQAIYAGPLEPAPWSSFMRLYRTTLSAIDIGLAIELPQLGARPLWLNDSATDPALARQYHQTWFLDDPWRTFPLAAGAVATLDEVIAPERLRHTQFFREFMVAHGAFFGMKAAIADADQGSAYLVVGRREREGNFDAAEQALCRRLLPHWQLALRYYRELALAELEQGAFSQLLGRSHRQVFWLDGLGRVLLQRGDKPAPSIRFTFGQFHLDDARADARLQRLVARGLNIAPPQAPLILGAVGFGDNDSLLVQALPPQSRLGSATPRLALHVSTGAPLAPAGLIADIFGLSAAEARLAQLLVQGHSLRSAAGALRLSEHTVRTQAKAIYRRTGCSGQTELVRRVLASVAGLG